jgi:hypothetical protein
MARDTRVGITRPPQSGVGWLKVATSLAEIVPPEDIESIWLFAPLRHEDREWGTAVVARRAEGGRRRIYTASYVIAVGGPERGQHKIAVEEVGEGPEGILHEVIAGVQERAGELEPPLEIPAETWYGDAGDEPAPES